MIPINKKSFLNYFKLINKYKISFYSQNVTEQKIIKYTNTINLPKTKFPVRLSTKKLLETEKRILNVNYIKICLII